MSVSRELIGSLIRNLTDVSKILASVEGHAETLKTCWDELVADQQALKERGFTGLPEGFSAALDEQISDLELASEAITSALNVVYDKKLAAEVAARNKVVPLQSSGDPPALEAVPSAPGPEETVAGCGDGGVTAAPPKKRNRVNPSAAEVECAERYGINPRSWMRMDRSDRGRIATRWKRGDRGAALTYGVMIPEPLAAVA